jgi:universal stress protein A
MIRAATRHTSDFADIIGRLQALLPRSRPCLKLKNILVPIDFTESSLRSVRYASFLADQFACTIFLVHVVHLNIAGEERGVPLTGLLDEMKSAAEWALQEIASSLGAATTRVVVRVGSPADQILLEAAESDIDLIVLGRHPRKGILDLFSPSVGKRIISGAPCPTLVAAQA